MAEKYQAWDVNTNKLITAQISANGEIKIDRFDTKPLQAAIMSRRKQQDGYRPIGITDFCEKFKDVM